MSDELLKFVVAPLVAAVVAAVLTTYLGARFNFSRFRKEQWWKEKRAAYDSIIKQLAGIMFTARNKLTELETGVPPAKPAEADKSLSWNLQEIASAGAYIVSDKTVEAVEQLLRAMEASYLTSAGDFYQELESDYIAAKEALTTVRNEAHRDLGVLNVELASGWFRRLRKG